MKYQDFCLNLEVTIQMKVEDDSSLLLGVKVMTNLALDFLGSE